MFGSMPIAARSERNSAPCATTSTAGGRSIARLAAATARRRNAANVSAPSGVNAPLTQSANQSLMPWPSCTPNETSRRSGSSATGNPNASPTNSAVTRARESGDATIVAMPRLRSFSAAARACATPTAFNGISTLPCEMPWAFQSVSPCRRNQNAIGESVRPPGTPRAPQFRPSCCITRCTAGRASMRLRCASQFAGSFMFMRLPPQNST